jgi:hypothetical protein
MLTNFNHCNFKFKTKYSGLAKILITIMTMNRRTQKHYSVEMSLDDYLVEREEEKEM